MTRREALAALQSSTMHERLSAARFFVKNATPDDYSALSAALAVETVVWVRSALQAALSRAGGKAAEESISSRVWEDVLPEDEAYARGVEDTTRQLIHEIEPLVGIVRRYATREITQFDDSRTARGLARLDETLDAISGLAKAAAVPRLKEFDLAELIRSVAESEALKEGVRIEFAGIAPLITMSDPAIVGIVVANAIRNAVEATRAGNRAHHPVVVNWGSTVTEYWLAVLDHGIGLPLSATQVYEIGRTTKADHLGMGLAICYRAAKTLGGNITLSRREEIGASFEFRWPHAYTDV